MLGLTHDIHEAWKPQGKELVMDKLMATPGDNAAALAETGKMKNIAYLAPEIPGLSSTFVYQEIIALERMGQKIVPISVHEPSSIAVEMKELADRTFYLYSGTWFNIMLNSLISFRRDYKYKRSFSALLSDMASIGIFSPTSWKLAIHFMMALCRLQKILYITIVIIYTFIFHTCRAT